MRRWFKRLILVGVLFLFLFFSLYPFHNALIVQSVKRGQVVFCARMAKGEEFILSYTHSVNKRPVYDTIRVEGASFLIVKSRFDSFGAGMPDASTEGMKLQTGKDGWLEWIVNQPVPEISFFLGWVANHSLHVKGQEIPLVRLAEAGELLSLRMEKVSRYDLWKGGCVR